MELCLMIEGQEGVSWDEWLALAQACEASGIPALFRSDHYLNLDGQHPERGALDAWGTICALAARTTTLRLGTMVSPASFRHPSVLAKLVTTADHVSAGRVELGLGAGWHEREHEAHGFPYPPDRRADGHPGGAAPDRARDLDAVPLRFRRHALPAARAPVRAAAGAAASSAPHHRRCRASPERGPRRSVRRRVQHDVPQPRRRGRAPRQRWRRPASRPVARHCRSRS